MPLKEDPARAPAGCDVTMAAKRFAASAAAPVVVLEITTRRLTNRRRLLHTFQSKSISLEPRQPLLDLIAALRGKLLHLLTS